MTSSEVVQMGGAVFTRRCGGGRGQWWEGGSSSGGWLSRRGGHAESAGLGEARGAAACDQAMVCPTNYNSGSVSQNEGREIGQRAAWCVSPQIIPMFFEEREQN